MVTEIELDDDEFDAIDDDESDEDCLKFLYDSDSLDLAELVSKYLEERLGCKVDLISSDNTDGYLLRITRPGETREPIKRTPKRNNAEIAMIIRKVKAMVQKGWCQGTSRVTDSQGKVIALCLLDAIDTVRTELDPIIIGRSWGNAYDTMKLSCQGAMNCDYEQSIVLYNETSGRTQKDVVDFLEKVARHEEGK